MNKKIKSIDHFKRLAVEMSPFQYCSLYLTPEEREDNFSEEVAKVIDHDGMYIDMYIDGTYRATIGNGEWVGKTLGEVQTYLWNEFAKFEYGLSEEERESDLHDQAREFMRSTKFIPCSLDEFIIEYGNAMSKEEMEMAEYITKQFQNHEDNITPKEKNIQTITVELIDVEMLREQRDSLLTIESSDVSNGVDSNVKGVISMLDHMLDKAEGHV